MKRIFSTEKSSPNIVNYCGLAYWSWEHKSLIKSTIVKYLQILDNLENLEILKILENLENLENIENFEILENLENLEILENNVKL